MGVIMTDWKALSNERGILLREMSWRIKVLEAALLDISSQKTTDEMDQEDINRADFEGAYDIIVGMARAALAEGQDK